MKEETNERKKGGREVLSKGLWLVVPKYLHARLGYGQARAGGPVSWRGLSVLEGLEGGGNFWMSAGEKDGRRYASKKERKKERKK